MSKNSTMKDSVNTAGCITKDENFKDVIRYKCIAALLLKLTIPDLNDMSLEEICRLIKDTRDRHTKDSKASILDDEIDFKATEAGTKDEKNTISDSVFTINIKGLSSQIKMRYLNPNEFTVNTEMQTSTKESNLGYNIISRAIYYGASLLRDTVPAGDTYYENLQKVYSIWFCLDDVKLHEAYPESEGQFIHRFGIRRFYKLEDRKVAPPEPDSDLIEVVLVELNKLRYHMDDEVVSLIYALFFNTNKFIPLIENHENIKLASVREGVSNMIDYEARMEVRLAEKMEERMAEERKRRYEDIKAMVEMNYRYTKSYKIAIENVVEALKLDEAIRQNLYNDFNVTED